MKDRLWSVIFVGAGVVLLVIAGGHILSTPATPSLVHLVLDLVFLVGSGLGFIAVGYWHWQKPLPRDRYPRLLGWVFAGVLLLMSINFITLYLGSDLVTLAEAFEVVRIGGSFGAIGGLLVGTVEANAIVQSREAASAQAKAQALEEEQEHFNQINAYLRHYALNSLTAIRGYTDHLAEEIPSDETAKLETIEDRIETITTLIDHILVLSTTLQEDAPRSESAVKPLLESALSKASVPQSVTLDVPADLPSIYTTPPFERALRLLFCALGEVLDPDESLQITATESGTQVTISISVADPVALTDADFTGSGSVVDIQLALAKEFINSTGTLCLGESTDDSLVCECTVPCTPCGQDT